MTKVSLTGLNVLVTRPGHSADGLIEGFQAAGASVRHIPLIHIQALSSDDDIAVLKRLMKSLIAQVFQ